MADFKAALELGIKRATDEQYFLERVAVVNQRACDALNLTCDEFTKYELRATPETGPTYSVVLRRHIRGGMDPDSFSMFKYNLNDAKINISFINADKYVDRNRSMIEEEYEKMIGEVFCTAAFGDYIRKTATKEFMEKHYSEKNR